MRNYGIFNAMIHFEISSIQHKKLQDLLIRYDRASVLMDAFSPEKLDFIGTQSAISNIGASTRIENALLTDVEIEWIDTLIKTEPHMEFANQERFIKDKLSKDKERSVEEVAGYRNALGIILSSSDDFYPLRVSQIKGLHREMLRYFRETDYHRGDFKTVPNTVLETHFATGRQTVILKTAGPGIATDASMEELVAWYNGCIREYPWTVAVAVEFVFRFLAIHPFQDGNGRLSRLLFLLALLAPPDSVFRKVVPLCGIDRTIEQTRKTYYYVLRQCSNGIFQVDPGSYRYGYFLDYMTGILAKGPENLTFYADKYERYRDLSASALKALALFKSEPERELKTGELVRHTGMARRTMVHVLAGLVTAGFISRSGRGAGSRYRLRF